MDISLRASWLMWLILLGLQDYLVSPNSIFQPFQARKLKKVHWFPYKYRDIKNIKITVFDTEFHFSSENGTLIAI